MIGTIKMDKQKIRALLKQESDYITDLLINFNVPDSLDEQNHMEYLLDNKGRDTKNLPANKLITVDEVEDRLNTIKNKMKTKKRKVSEKSLKRREAKKLQKNKEFKKVIKSAHKTLQIKESAVENICIKNKDVKTVSTKPIFNAEGKIVFSKFDFAAHPGAKTKKSKSEKFENNPQLILNKMKEADKKLQELENQGEEEKVKKIKTEMVWKKAFDKVDGKKVKDDPKILYKAIKRKKDEKKKSKKLWVERKNKVEKTIQNKQKKRTENINKRLKDNKNKKLKKLSKKGRIIPGF